MNQKDLIKYGLIALGAYLIWKYIQDNGGFEGIFGSVTGSDTTGTKAVADAAADKAKQLAAAAAANPTDATAAAAAKKAAADAVTAAAAAKKAIDDAAAAAKRVPCWNGNYYATAAECPAQAPAATGKTPAQLAAETAQAPKTQLYNQLIAQGVDGVTAQTYIEHCGANGQCDATYYAQMLQQAALGVPNMMKLTDVGGILFNPDQWQYYRAQGGGADLDPGLFFSDRTSPIHASTFNAAINSGGMSGWGLGAYRYTPAWLM